MFFKTAHKRGKLGDPLVSLSAKAGVRQLFVYQQTKSMKGK